jgi:hypothetical protein
MRDDEREEECDVCGEAFSGERAIRGYLRDVETVFGLERHCTGCLDRARRDAAQRVRICGSLGETLRKLWGEALGLDLSAWTVDVGGGGSEVTWWVILTSPTTGAELHADDVYVNDETAEIMQWTPNVRL